MAYIGKKPSDKFRGLAYKDSFTGDGSTVAFDLANEAPDGGEYDLHVFIDNVRQEGGTGKAYTLGVDGSGDMKRITFTSAPDSGSEVYVINPGRDSGVLQVGDNAVTSVKLATTVINAQTGKATPIGADEVLLYDSASSGNKKLTLDNLFANPQAELITSQSAVGELAADNDQLLIYDTSAGALKKINKSNIATVLNYPTITSIDTSYIAPATATSFTITGTNFTNNMIVQAISSTGAITNANSVTYNNATSLTVNFTIASEGDYYLRLERNDGLAVRSSTALLGVNNDPTWTTSAGSLGSVAGGGTMNFSAYATETDSGPITYALVSGSLPGGASLSTNNSIAYITGTETGSSANTTYTFSLEATDDESQKATREFSILVTHGASGGGGFN